MGGVIFHLFWDLFIILSMNYKFMSIARFFLLYWKFVSNNKKKFWFPRGTLHSIHHQLIPIHWKVSIRLYNEGDIKFWWKLLILIWHFSLSDFKIASLCHVVGLPHVKCYFQCLHDNMRCQNHRIDVCLNIVTCGGSVLTLLVHGTGHSWHYCLTTSVATNYLYDTTHMGANVGHRIL